MNTAVVEVIPGSRVIRFMAYPEEAQVALRGYGKLILAVEEQGPPALRVDPTLDFESAITTVEAWLSTDKRAESQ